MEKILTFIRNFWYYKLSPNPNINREVRFLVIVKDHIQEQGVIPISNVWAYDISSLKNEWELKYPNNTLTILYVIPYSDIFN